MFDTGYKRLFYVCEVDKKAFFEYLCEYITPERRALFESVAQKRSRHLSICLEDIFQPQNASAVLRTCDLIGIQDIYTIESRNEYNPNPDVALGAQQWLNRSSFNNSKKAVKTLREKGYKIVATSPHSSAFSPETLPIDEPLALFFGTEKEGLTEEILSSADYHLKIPMHGFTESYNISVSAAICLYTINNRLRNSSIDWALGEEEQIDLLIEWASKTVKRPDLLKQEFLKSQLS